MAQVESKSFHTNGARRWLGITFTFLVNIGLYVIIDGLFSVDVTILKSGVLS